MPPTINQQDNLLESISDGILAINLNEMILFSNRKFSNKFLFHKEKENIQELRNVFIDEEILTAFRECLKLSETRKVYDYKIRHKNRDLFFEILITPLLNEENQKVEGAVGVFRNVTEAKLTEQMRVDFVANVSHEIRTPLTSIKGFAQVLQSQHSEFNHNQKDYIDKIATNAERLHELFSDLLNLSVIESQHRLVRKTVNLKLMLESVKSMLLQNYRHKSIEIAYDLKVEEVKVDHKLFEQALINLIDNACKYAGKNPRIKIETFLENQNVILNVYDDGPGISKEHLGRIFERFYRVDSSRSKAEEAPKGGGTGLGLSIVKHIINKHKGKISVKSSPKSGTVFKIELPLREDDTLKD